MAVKKVFVVLLLLFFFTIPVTAAAMPGEAGEEAKTLLGEIGIEEGSVEELLSISPKRVMEVLLSVTRGNMDVPLRCAGIVISVMLLSAVCRTFSPEDKQYALLLESICLLVLLFLVFSQIAAHITAARSAMAATVVYSKTLVPVLAGVLTVSGKPSLALCFQTACLSLSQILSVLAEEWLAPLTSVYAVLVAAGAVQPVAHVEKAAELIKKGIIFVLSLFAALFSAVLSVKSVITSAADTVAVKGAKFLIGSAVPVVGGAISEALGSVLSGIGLMRNTTGIIGIILIVLTNLPTLVLLIVWVLLLRILAMVASVLGQTRTTSFFEAACGIYTILIATVCLLVFLLLVAVALVILVAGR